MAHAALTRGQQAGTRAVAGWRLAVRSMSAGRVSYPVILMLDPADRISMVKEGLPARLLVTLASDMQVPRERLYDWIGIARTTANRKVKGNQALSQDESEKALGITRLIGLVEKVVTESGDPAGFDAARWVAQWLHEPNAALGGR